MRKSLGDGHFVVDIPVEPTYNDETKAVQRTTAVSRSGSRLGVT